MKITWIGHACFKIETNGYAIVTDPFDASEVPGYKAYKTDADMVLVTHEHYDHNFRDAVTLSGRECPVNVEFVEAFHDDAGGSILGPNKIIIIDDGTFRIAHFGDIGHILSEEQLERIGKLDGAILNVGGFTHSNAEFADKLARQLNPTWIFPSHFKTENYGFEGSGTLNEFLNLQNNGVEALGSSMELYKESGTHTVIFEKPLAV